MRLVSLVAFVACRSLSHVTLSTLALCAPPDALLCIWRTSRCTFVHLAMPFGHLELPGGVPRGPYDMSELTIENTPSAGTNKSGPKPTPKSQPQSVVSAAVTLSSASKRALPAGGTTRSAEKPKPKPKSQPRPNVSTGKKRVGPCAATGARKGPVIKAVPSRRSAPSVRARGRAAPSAPE